MGAEMFVLEATEKLALQKDRVPLVKQVARVSQKTITFDAITSQALSLPRNTVQPVQILPKIYFQVLGMMVSTDLPTFKRIENHYSTLLMLLELSDYNDDIGNERINGPTLNGEGDVEIEQRRS